jgi:hypothetical protein
VRGAWPISLMGGRGAGEPAGLRVRHPPGPRRQPLQQSRDLRRVPMTTSPRRRDEPRFKRCSDAVEARYTGRTQLGDDWRQFVRDWLARADRALSAMLGARWPVWRPVGMTGVCHRAVKSLETLSPRGAGLIRVKCYPDLAKQEAKQARGEET